MHGYIRIGRVFGIDLAIDLSWILVFLLMTFGLATGFGGWHPSWDPALRALVAALATVLFFASVLLHELAHSLVAKANGIPVTSITLFLFGGVSNIQHEPESPRVEFVMAVAGPLTSMIVGVLLLLLGRAVAGSDLRDWQDADGPTAVVASLGPVATLLMWAGSASFTVGVFNLIPGFPLDGGRMLRAALWKATDDFKRSTRWAAGIGQAVGWAFVAMGIAMAFGAWIPFFGGGLVGGLWLTLIGWFLRSAATQTYAQVALRDEIEAVTVRQLARAVEPGVQQDMTVRDLVDDWFTKRDDRAYAVMNGDAFVGLVSLRDALRAPRDAWDQVTVKDVMVPARQLATAAPGEALAAAIARFGQGGLWQVPVVDDGRLVGMLFVQDVVAWMKQHPGRPVPPRLHGKPVAT